MRKILLVTCSSVLLASLLFPALTQVQAGELSATSTATQKRYLIIHADDAGMSHSVNMATMACLESGIVSSTSIMVPTPWFSEFADYAKKNPQHDYGVHLTLNSEWDHYRWGPVAPREKVASLIDKDGYLWDNVKQVVKHAKADEVAIELRAQIDRAKQFGIPLSHLDTHMGALLSRPDLVQVYVNLALEYALPILFLRDIPPRFIKAYPGLATGTKRIVKTLDENNLPLLDSVLQFYGGENLAQRKENYYQALENMKAGVGQLIIHCGFDDKELRAITKRASRRNGDRLIFTSQETATFLKDQNIQLLNWKQFRAMQTR
ncbi:polysaccharide deacetylase family protein [Thalassomonas sp. RHCl1]|uniref:polysaccharide deacetylase family protein n=1 Tax=Thalassomonas sp. RHCl1 TaxID=2995320 RepID=UPI00248A9B2E|nr:polysaccharide deacetylase family protein [Thalassomonas sp. RHCl1]